MVFSWCLVPLARSRDCLAAWTPSVKVTQWPRLRWELMTLEPRSGQPTLRRRSTSPATRAATRKYRRLEPDVHQALQRLTVVIASAARDDHTTLHDIARAHGCSPAHVYKFPRKTLEGSLAKTSRPQTCDASRHHPHHINDPARVRPARPHCRPRPCDTSLCAAGSRTSPRLDGPPLRTNASLTSVGTLGVRLDDS